MCSKKKSKLAGQNASVIHYKHVHSTFIIIYAPFWDKIPKIKDVSTNVPRPYQRHVHISALCL